MQSLSKDELRELLAAARAVRERDFCMILMAYSHGLRATELISVVRADLDDGCLDVRRLKGSLHTIQPLLTSADPLFNEREALIQFVKSMTRNRRLFPVTRQRFWQIIRQHGKTAGIPVRKLHPHALKHSIAMQTIHSAGIENVRQYLGHKSIGSTGAYLKVSDADASAAVALAVSS